MGTGRASGLEAHLAGQTVLVTGGGGFLGAAIVHQLVERGARVRTLGRSHYPTLDALPVEQRRGDIRFREHVFAAVDGVDAVIHCASKVGVWGDESDYRAINVEGTRNVIAACHRYEVKRLIHTSTPSVVHPGGDIEGGDETLPYARRPSTHYQSTKITAEREALAAHGNGLKVLALRPHLIWGPGDPHLVPRIISRVRRGRIALPNGGRQVVDTLFIDNAADAHVHALERIGTHPECGGKPYFITNGEPLPLREIVLGILRAAQIDAKVVSVPSRVAHIAGAVLESTFRFVGAKREPPLTRFVAEQLSTSHYFDLSAARNQLGWTPEISIADGLRLLERHFR